jgi:hypothetical protein
MTSKNSEPTMKESLILLAITPIGVIVSGVVLTTVYITVMVTAGSLLYLFIKSVEKTFNFYSSIFDYFDKKYQNFINHLAKKYNH